MRISTLRVQDLTHLEARYRNRSWVIVDGDAEGKEVLTTLQSKYCATWEEDRFRSWSEEDFERYFPDRFRARVDDALALSGREKRETKRDLLNDVIEWIESDPATVREELAESAQEVIVVLQEIEATLFGGGDA